MSFAAQGPPPGLGDQDTGKGETTLLENRDWEGCAWIGGRWHSEGCSPLAVMSPGSGLQIATIGEVDPARVGAVVAEADRAGRAWAARPPEERQVVLTAAADLLARAAPEVVWWLVRESGSISRRAEANVGLAARRLLRAAATAASASEEQMLEGPRRGERSVARRVPYGVVVVITPWNSPLVLAVRALAPALAAGNAVVLKPDQRTPVSGGIVLARVFEEAGLPPGVLQVLPGGPLLGEALIGAPGVAKVSFTGSTAAGRRVGALAGGALASVSLELGGNNPLIVLDDADVQTAAAAGARGSFGHQGQVCMATGRHLVDERVAEPYVAALVRLSEQLRVGDPAREEVDVGPLISASQTDRVERIVSESVAAGAVLRAGGRREGNFYWPTVLEAVTPSMPAFIQEVFGPVAAVTAVKGLDEAIALANDTAYGLVASVFTSDERRGMEVLDRVRSGVGHVNDETVKSDAEAPFGGFGCSGNGARYGGVSDLDEFTTWRWLTLRSQGAPPLGEAQLEESTTREGVGR